MALTLTTSGSLNTTVDNYAFSILSNTSSVQLGAVSLKLVVPGGCTIKNVNAGTSSISSLEFLQKDGNLNVSLTSVSNWVVNTNDVILSITASGMSTGSFTLNTNEDWYCEIASSSAEPFTDFAIKMPSLASPYVSVSTTLEAVSILSGVNPSITAVGAPNSSVFGSGSRTSGTASIAEGIRTLASGLASHAAGINTTASGQAAFSMGIETDADGMASFAAGSGSWARGTATVAMGIGTVASSSGQLVVGHYNETKTDINNIFVVGDGTSNSLRRNVIEVYGGQGASFRGVKIDTVSPSGPPTTVIDGFNVYGKTRFFGDVTGSSMLANNFNANGLDATIQLLGTSTGSFTSNFYRRQNVLGGGPGDFEDVLKASVRLDHRGINFSLSEQTTAPGSTFLWTNSSNRLFYSSSAVILNDGNTLGSAMTIGTTDANNLQLETNNTTRIFISSSGNVGIGTSSPTERLYVDGNLLVTGRITAEEFHTEFVSASIIYQSGSTQFGNSLDDTHIFTGSLKVNGSITGSLFGTSSWAVNALTASFITPTGTNAFVQGGNSFGTTALLGTNDTQDLQLETNGSVRMTISSSGNIGIGTTSPLSTLTVAGGNINIGTGYGIGGNNLGTYNPILTYWNDGVAGAVQSASFGFRSSAYMDSIAYPNLSGFGTNDLRFFTSTNGIATPSEIIRIVGSTGFVGIGESSPSAKLEIKGSGATSATTAFRVENSNASASLTILNDGTSAFNTNHLYVSSSGNIGIGTTSPSVRLHLSQSSGTFQRVDINNANADGVNATTEYYTNTGATPDLFGATSFRLQGGTTDAFKQFQVYIANLTSPRFIINGSGNVGIGTTSPSVRLHISGTSATNELVYLTGDASQGSAIRFNRGSSYSWRMGVVPNSNFTIEDVSYSTTRFQINNTSGLIGINTTSPNARLHISGANNEALLIASSSTAPSALFVSGSGNVGIGTATPERRLHADASGSANTDIPLLLTSVDANNRVGIRFASSSLSAGRQHNLYHRVNTATAEWLLGTNAGETAQWNFIPRDDTNYAIALRTPFNGGTAQITTGLSQSLFSLGAGGTANQHLNISSSGNVGIGTTTPTSLLQVAGRVTSTELYITNGDAIYTTNGSVGIGTSGPTSTNRLQVRGSGATSATTALRVENSAATALLTILNDGTSAFNTNHLYVSSSGNIGIGTATPTARLQIAGTSNDGISLDANNTLFNGVNARLPGRIIVGASSTGYPKIMYNAIPSASVSWSYSGNDTAWAINMGGGNRMGFEYVAPGTAGTSFSGWNTIMALVSGSNSVGIGTLTPTNTLQVVGGITATSITASIISASSGITGSLFGTSSWAVNALTASFLSGAFLQNGNSFGTTAVLGTNDTQNLQFETSGSVRMTISSSGNVGIGTTTPSASLHVEGNFQISTGSLYTYGQNTDIDSGSFRTVMSISTGSYRAAFFDYVLTSGSNARAGTVFSVWQGTSVEYADTSTNDIGNTTGVNLLVSMSGANIGLFASSSNDNWSMKALARML